MAKILTISGNYESPVTFEAPVKFNGSNGADDVIIANKTLPRTIVDVLESAGIQHSDRLVVKPGWVSIYSFDGIEIARFTDIEEAMQKYDGLFGSVKLESDITVRSPISVTKDVVFDLNGHTITVTNDIYMMNVKNGADVKIKNGNFVCGNYGVFIYDGKLTLSDVDVTMTATRENVRLFNVVTQDSGIEAKAVLIVDSDSTITCNNLESTAVIFVRSEKLSKFPGYISANRSSVYFNGKIVVNSKYKTDTEKYNYAICDNGSDVNGTNIVIGDGAVITCDNGPAIHHAARGGITLNGGTIEGSFAGITIRTGYIDAPSFSTVVVKGTGPHKDYDCGHASSQGASRFETGDGILVESCSYGSDTTTGLQPLPPQMNIKGGKYLSVNGNPIGSYQHAKYEFAQYTQADYDAGTKVAGGSLGVVGKYYIITNMTKTRSQWIWGAEVDVNNIEYYPRVTGFVHGGVLGARPTTIPYAPLTGYNGSYAIVDSTKTIVDNPDGSVTIQ